MSRKEPKSQRNHTLDELISVLKRHLPEIRERYGVRAMGIFGSYIRGQQRKRSDLDILVEFDNGTLTLFQFVELRDFLSDLLKVKVDLVEKRALKPAIGKHILEEVVFV
ncbi:MAG: nucleotidyltransferase family protein [Candidatus Binatia bacterium]